MLYLLPLKVRDLLYIYNKILRTVVKVAVKNLNVVLLGHNTLLLLYFVNQ